MLAKLHPRSVYDVLAVIGCFAGLSTGAAYAANEWNSSNIQNETLIGADVKGTHGTSTTPGTNGSLTGADISGQPSTPTGGQPFVDGSLTTYDIANNNLTGDDVQGNSLKGADIDEGSLVGGPGHPSGVAGGDLTGSYPNPQLRADAVGSDELKSSVTVSESAPIPPHGGVGEVVVTCPFGSKRLSGGARFEFPSGDISMSTPLGTARSWFAEGQNNGNVEQDLVVEALCLAQF